MSVAASIYLPQFTIGETAFDGFKNEMGKFGNRVAVIHGERAWKAPVSTFYRLWKRRNCQ